MTATTVQRAFRASVLAAALTISITLSTAARAVPIPFAGGLLDGVLRTYALEITSDFTKYDVVLLRNYVLGVDFFPAVPLSFQNGMVPYSRCVADGINLSVLNNPPECLSFFFPVTTLPFGEGDLRDGCSFIANAKESPPGRPIMVERGGCTFREKWAFAQSEGWGGVMVVNDAPGPVGPTGLIEDSASLEPTIAFMRLTQDVGQQIRSDRGGRILALQMSVTWTPAVPVPPTLALLGLGLAGLGWNRRK